VQACPPAVIALDDVLEFGRNSSTIDGSAGGVAGVAAPASAGATARNSAAADTTSAR